MDINEINSKAAIKAAQRLADLKALTDTPEIAQIEAKEAERKALQGKNASHKAVMADYGSGQVLGRAIASYKVKRTVADFAKSEGRTVTGAAIVVPAPAPEVESTVADFAKSEGRTVTGAAIVVPAPAPEVESETANA